MRRASRAPGSLELSERTGGVTGVRPLRGELVCHDARAVPTYDYQCRACGTVTEVIHAMLEDGPSVCELCGGTLRRVLYPTGIIFKGSGFYRNDSRASSSNSSSSDASDKGGRSDKSGGSENNGGSSSEKKAGSTTPEGGSSESKAPSTDASST